ncbi:cysteine-rich DPF motif domain-containing protein 1 isoform X2 [Ursus maritimus]|uniref:Cysteine-rich DPF motif domain-containing protein 1 n=1 Tax=Ursus maritimus TaxID=29073 RepID=A0A8M1GPU3_URSMA|nr:cysteine-rich DPF motif domain-containing protein 1 isoform X2 [Ursus maritimus]
MLECGWEPLRFEASASLGLSQLVFSLLEESYVMKDPFTSDKDRFLVLGSKCSLCSRLVCVGPVGEHGCLPSGNPARLGEKESSIEEAGQPAWLSDMNAAGCQVGSSTSHRAPGPAGPLQPGSGMVRSWELSCPALFRARSNVCSRAGRGPACSRKVTGRPAEGAQKADLGPDIPQN